jgi:2-phosphoglycolate phosphatase
VSRFAALLFDLDGTLIDSAPDLAGTANDMRRARGWPEMPYAELRPLVGGGARAMVGRAFGVEPDSAEFGALRDEFLQRYSQRLLSQTGLFEAVDGVLDALDAQRMPWGIVTNKVERFTTPVVEGLALHSRAAAVVSGDTTAHSKPHPEPLLEAARRMGVEPAACVYIGDDLRDVQAGRAAGMQTAVATWGYLGEGEPFSRWGADFVLDMPHEILKLAELD